MKSNSSLFQGTGALLGMRQPQQLMALLYHTITPMTKEERVRKIHSVFVEDWQQKWLGDTRDSGTGLFLLQIKDKIENWSWASNKNRLVK
jgi:hypothetical protein